MASTAVPGANSEGSSVSKNARPTATHVLASSIAVPSRSALSKLRSRLAEMAVQISPLTQRDVFCVRTDELDEGRSALEQDARFGPVRRARVQSRLTLRFEAHSIDMRVLAKPAAKGPEFTDIYNLTVVPLHTANDAQQTSDQRRTQREASGKLALPTDLNAGQDHWQQVAQCIGWTPKSNVIRIGTRFALRTDTSCRVEAHLFQLYRLDEMTGTMLDRIADTNVLQVTATMPLATRGRGNEEHFRDASQLYKIAQAEIAAVQEILQGIVQLRKEEES